MPKTKAQSLAHMVVEHLQQAGELPLLADVIKALQQDARHLGVIDSAIVTSPIKLTASELAAIGAYVKSEYGKQYELVERIDPSLIAGFTVRIGDQVIDASLSAKLEIIRKELV